MPGFLLFDENKVSLGPKTLDYILILDLSRPHFDGANAQTKIKTKTETNAKTNTKTQAGSCQKPITYRLRPCNTGWPSTTLKKDCSRSNCGPRYARTRLNSASSSTVTKRRNTSFCLGACLCW